MLKKKNIETVFRVKNDRIEKIEKKMRKHIYQCTMIKNKMKPFPYMIRLIQTSYVLYEIISTIRLN